MKLARWHHLAPGATDRRRRSGAGPGGSWWRASGSLHRTITAALLLLLPASASLPGCASNSQDRHGAVDSLQAEARIQSAIVSWYGALARTQPGAGDPDDALDGSDLQFTRSTRLPRDGATLVEWASALRSEHREVRFRISKFRVDESSDAVLRAHFDLERESVDTEGVRHLLRRQQDWRVEPTGEGPIRVLGIAEEPLLAFPGTGPQIVCY